MPAGYKNFRMRGGVDENDFPSREVTLKQIRTVSKIAWEKWGPLIADYPLRDLLALAYAEGLYHGAMIGLRDPELRNTIGMTPGSDLAAVASVSPSKTTEIEPLSVRDLLESL